MVLLNVDVNLDSSYLQTVLVVKISTNVTPEGKCVLVGVRTFLDHSNVLALLASG
jgi:hypothetical protein